MRFVKLGIICVVVLLIVLSGLSLIFPSHLRVTRFMRIAAATKGTADSTKASVISAISDLRTWDHWETFIRTTPQDDRHYSEPASGPGAWFQSGGMKVTLTGVDRDSVHAHWALSSGKQFEGGYYLYEMTSDSVTVQGWMEFHFRWYPWERLGILLYDKRLGPVLEESLGNLKEYIGKTPYI